MTDNNFSSKSSAISVPESMLKWYQKANAMAQANISCLIVPLLFVNMLLLLANFVLWHSRL